MSFPSKISRSSVVEAALAVIDEGGVTAVSMEKIATRLDVRAPSLYHHFANKAEILCEVAVWIVKQTVVPVMPESGDWREWLVSFTVNMRQAVLRHPNAAVLLFEYFPREPISSAYERTSKYLQSFGVPEQVHALIFEGLTTITLGSALHAALEAPRELSSGSSTRDQPFAASVASHGWADGELFTETVRAFVYGVTETSRVRELD